MKRIILTKGYEAIIDDDDIDLIERYKWQVNEPKGQRYAFHSSTRMSMHRLIMDALPGQEVDHINGDGLDNRRSNLRFVTVSQNQMNAKKCETPTSSQYKGVHWEPDRQKWGARIKAEGKYLRLGRFAIEEDAARAYNQAALKYYGEYARLNLIVPRG